MALPKWHYRKRNGFAIGGWVFGYERRDYAVTVNMPVAWPTLRRDRFAPDGRPECGWD